VGIKNTASIEEAFSLFNKLNLQVDQVSGFYYTSPYPKDSLANLIAYLNTKPYINTRNFSATVSSVYSDYQTGVVTITNSLFGMTVTNQKDWINSKKLLMLVDKKTASKDISLKVPIGMEKYWLVKLKEYSIVTWTEFNCMIRIVFP
jgi:hypothetical protein